MKPPALTGREVLAALRRGEFLLDHVRGSHHYLRGPTGCMVTVAVHAREDVPPGTLRSILRQAGLTVEEFTALL